MNYRMVAFVLGRIFAIEACLMLFPLICGMLYGEWYLLPAFLLPAALLAVLGFITRRKTPKNTTIFARDGLAIVALVGADECLRCAALCDFRRNTVLY